MDSTYCLQLDKKELQVLSTIVFPDGFNDAGGKTFKHVYDKLPEFVHFSRHWETSTGLFKRWGRYIELRDKQNKKKPNVNICSKTGKPVFQPPESDK